MFSGDFKVDGHPAGPAHRIGEDFDPYLFARLSPYPYIGLVYSSLVPVALAHRQRGPNRQHQLCSNSPCCCIAS